MQQICTQRKYKTLGVLDFCSISPCYFSVLCHLRYHVYQVILPQPINSSTFFFTPPTPSNPSHLIPFTHTSVKYTCCCRWRCVRKEKNSRSEIYDQRCTCSFRQVGWLVFVYQCWKSKTLCIFFVCYCYIEVALLCGLVHSVHFVFDARFNALLIYCHSLCHNLLCSMHYVQVV